MTSRDVRYTHTRGKTEGDSMERQVNLSVKNNEARAIPTRDRVGNKTVTIQGTFRYGRQSSTNTVHLDREAAMSLYRQLGAIL